MQHTTLRQRLRAEPEKPMAPQAHTEQCVITCVYMNGSIDLRYVFQAQLDNQDGVDVVAQSSSFTATRPITPTPKAQAALAMVVARLHADGWELISPAQTPLDAPWYLRTFQRRRD